jgi:hypothetical protein
MRRCLASLHCVTLGSALVAALSLAAPAGARKFQMSGNWVIRNGQVFIPLQFVATAMGTGMQMIHVSMGNLTGAFGFPNNAPIPGLGGVTAIGSARATLRVPPHRFVQDAFAAIPLSSGLVQVTTNFGVDAPFAAATLAPLGGPGSFTWCPGDALCADGAGTMLGSEPPQGMGSRNGRVIYRAGANRFGGAMQIGLRRGGSNSFVFASFPALRVAHLTFGGQGTTLRTLPNGALGSADAPAVQVFQHGPGIVTQPLTFMNGLIVNPGPRVTTMLGLTNTMTGPTLLLNPGGTGGPTFQPYTSHYGFAHTTGTVFAQQTAGTAGDDFFTFMGYDKRTALGAGAIQTVAGGLSFRTTNLGVTPYASMHRVRMLLGAPIPSLSPGGVAAAGALMLLAAGYARRRGTSASSE